MHYPRTRRGDVVEELHGVRVADPFRWLEDPDAPEVVDWVRAQRACTEEALATLPGRPWFSEAMKTIVARPRAGVPLVRGGRWFVSRNDGTTDQDIWYTATSEAELLSGGRVVLDPNTWSTDGTTSLSTFSVARDGSLLAYAKRIGGSDWQHFRVRDLATGEDLPDEVVGKFSNAPWLPDHRSFLYTSFAGAEGARGTDTAGLGAGTLMVHRLDGDDEALLSFPDDPRVMAYGEVSDDLAWLVVTLVRGTENRNRVWAYPITTANGRSTLGEPVKVVDEPVAEFGFVRTDGAQLYLSTDLDAPMGRVVRVDLDWAATGDVEFAEVVPEQSATLLAASAAGGGLLLAHLVDAEPVVSWMAPDDEELVELDLPPGALVALDGSPERDHAYVGLSTLDSPTRAFRIDLPGPDAGEPRVTAIALEEAGDAGPGFAPGYTVARHAATSTDGVDVPYFLITPEGAPDGPRPTLLYGYGGFKIPVAPDYRAGWPAWLAAGGTLAIANLRGGGEFGTTWYDQGRLSRKQQVFDDAIAIAEHLVSTGVTSPDHLAVHGRSNGGLLVGALITQRPDLFAVALPTVGVLDLLRFHRFTIGAAWMSDYGDPDTPEGFADAYAYSPLHRVVDGTEYPATLIATADHDDRVVPLHSYKFGASLQAAQAGDAPILLRIAGSAGHGAGTSLSMAASEWADLLAFAAAHTGLVVPPAAEEPS